VKNMRPSDYSLALEDRGMGIPLMFIHGYPLNRNIWKRQWEDLADLVHVIAPDLRGHGESVLAANEARNFYPFSMELLADDCVHVLDILKITQPVILCGLSMGGYISFALYRKYPDRVAGLILAATRSNADSPDARINRQNAVDLVRSSGVQSIVDSMLPRMLAPKTFAENPRLVQQVQDIMLSSTVEGIIGDSLGMKDRPDSTGLLSGIHLPTLILLGAEDQFISTREAEGMHAAIQDSRLVVMPDAGHLLNMEKPELFNHEIRGFINSFFGGKQ